MERTNYQASNCSIARTLQVLGEKWTLLIIREASTAPRDSSSSIGCCSARATAVRTAGQARRDGILERSEYREPGARARHEYRLTAKGIELTPILLAIRHWGDRNEADPQARPFSHGMPDAGRKYTLRSDVRAATRSPGRMRSNSSTAPASSRSLPPEARARRRETGARSHSALVGNQPVVLQAEVRPQARRDCRPARRPEHDKTVTTTRRLTMGHILRRAVSQHGAHRAPRAALPAQPPPRPRHAEPGPQHAHARRVPPVHRAPGPTTTRQWIRRQAYAS